MNYAWCYTMQKPLVLVALILFAVVPSATAGGFCAVRVEVRTATGLPVSRRPVQLLGPSGQIVQSSVIHKGSVAFCDFDFGQHSIVVDPGYCGERRINNVQIDFDHEQVFQVLTGGCPPGEFMHYGGCVVWLRIRSAEEGGKVENAKVSYGYISGDGLPDRVASASVDSFGRTQLVVGENRRVIATVSAPGFITGEKILSCARPTLLRVVVELKVSLRSK